MTEGDGRGPEDLTYRLYRERDLPGLLRLWEEETPWGRLEEDTWREWYMDTPYGESIISVSIAPNGEVVGHIAFSPRLLHVGGRQIDALRMSAAIVEPRYRTSKLRDRRHPMASLLTTAVAAAADRGYGVIYALPAPRLIPWFRWLGQSGIAPFTVSEFPCLEIVDVEKAVGSVGGLGLVAGSITTFTEEHEHLAVAAAETFGTTCMAVKQEEWLQWRNGGHARVEIRDPAAATLVGFATVRPEDGLLMDLVTPSRGMLEPVLRTLLRWLPVGSAAWDPEVHGLKVVGIPSIEPVARELGFAPVSYTFGLAGCRLDATLPDAILDLDRWYLWPGD